MGAEGRGESLGRRLFRGSEGQAVAEFSLVVFILVLVLFSILRMVPGLGEGFHDRRVSEAAVVKRTRW